LEHVSAVQAPATHWPLVQSESTVQPPPSVQLEQLPPQSVSVSVPFFTPSVQLGATQEPAVQTPL